MQCKKCEKELAENEYHMVAEWPFCHHCFEELMAPKPAPPSPLLNQEEKPAAPPPVTCHLCGKDLAGQPSQKMGIWDFCRECHADLNMSPRSAQPALEETDPPSAPLKAQVAIDVTDTINCLVCDREVPKGGARQKEDAYYCPDCFYALPENQEVDPAALIRQKTIQTCESCGREVQADELKKHEGFRICGACLNTDPELALEIARKKHQERLKGMVGGMG